jgi:spore germination cell wall hydrolase CwlJ-like protein
MESQITRTVSHATRVLALLLVLAAIVWTTHHTFDRARYEQSRMSVSFDSAADKMKQLECLTRNIYWEAASEPFEGKVAVAQVTLNRLQSGKFADSVCGVVYQKNVVYSRVICQFSWYCEPHHLVRPVHRPMWNESNEVAKRVLFEGLRLPSLEDALYYHADYVQPGWRKPRIEKIGRHIFYGERV